MTKKQFLQAFRTATRCIFTVLTAEAAVFLAVTYHWMQDGVSGITAFRQIPLCVEYLAAGIILYLILASAAAQILREYST